MKPRLAIAAACLLVAAAGAQQHWAYRPLLRPTPPAAASGFGDGPIDAFVAAKLAAAGLPPSPPADRAVWLRRAALDLRGLPPTPDELAAFLADDGPDAKARAADALMAGPAFGERWAQWWLDLARYADSQGYEKDDLRPTMWRWREWVIDAFAAGMPLDRFTVEQLAGDLLPDATVEQRLATAFHRQTMTNTEGGTDDEEFRVAAVVDRVDTTMQVWMGSTLGCAQCHDHKYDRFAQREFFQLYAYFDQTEDRDRGDDEPKLVAQTAAQRAASERIAAELAAIRPQLVAEQALALPARQAGVFAPEPACVRRDDGSAPAAALVPALARLREHAQALTAQLAAHRGPAVPVLRELPAEQRRTTRIHRRGSFLDPGDPVQPGLPAVWDAWRGDEPAPTDRLGFARWLVSPRNPLTPRVLANRLWCELFGQGLVTTLEDFGVQGEPPSHPELLDWLACELRDGGWSLRGFLKQIVLSATYGQSSAQTPAHREHDPYNRLLARGAAFRLSAETLRDQALAVAGLLAPTVGGPSVMPPQPDGVWLQMYSGAHWHAAQGPDRYRRALYTFWRRTSPHPAMLVFDAQSREACVLRRVRTNTPLQALVLWNDPQFREPAVELAALAHAAAAVEGDVAGVALLWRRCLCRRPSDGERARSLQLLADERAHLQAVPQQAEAMVGAGREGAVELAAWSVLASVVLALDEFVTRR
jgi:hypothetical protein